MKNKEYVDWKEWQNKEQLSLCDLYVHVGYCKPVDNQLAQFEAYNRCVEHVYRHRDQFLKEMLYASPGLRDFLIIHSKFRDEQNMDWLELRMMELLRPTDEDVKRIYAVKPVPKELLEKLAIFDPEPLGVETDTVRVEYEFFGRGSPILVIDTNWEQIGYDAVNVEAVLSQFAPIDAGAPELVKSDFDDDDLPF